MNSSVRTFLEETDTHSVNHEVLAYFLNYQFVPKPLTITGDSINPVCKQFNFNDINNSKDLKNNEDEICTKLYSRLREVIKKQLPNNEKPIGILLSGGFDSAAVLHILRDITDRKIYTLTGAYSKNAQNLVSAKGLAERYKTVHDELIISPDSIKKIDEIYSCNIPQPIGDNGFLATYLMVTQLREKTRHVFSGDGADCLFSGLKMHHLNLVKKLDNTMSSKEGSVYEHYRFGEIFLDRDEADMLFEGKSNNIKLEDPFKQIANKIKTDDPIKRQVFLDLNFLVKNRVDYIIYAAKAAGVDIRLPYLDGQLVRFAVRIPTKYVTAHPEQPKYILKKAFEGKLPQSVLSKKSKGFTPPFKFWYRTNKEFVILKLIRSKRLGLSPDYIKRLIYSYKNNDNYVKGMNIWLMLNLVSWYDARCAAAIGNVP